MSKLKGVERIMNDDGSELKVMAYDDKIVVHEKDAEGSSKGHVTDWFDNPGIHITDENDNKHWEGKSPENKE